MRSVEEVNHADSFCSRDLIQGSLLSFVKSHRGSSLDE